MTRIKAASLHLSISVIAACVMGALLYFLWFPQPWFIAAGASTLILLLMGVDVCVGPLLTLIVFSPTKRPKLLRMDLAIIALVQIVAFAYGLSVIVQARPVFIVAAVDRYVVVSADQLADTDLAKGSEPAFRQRSWHGPRLVGAVPPKTSPDSIMQVLATGKDIDRLPQYYVPYAQVAHDMIERAQPLSNLHPQDARQRDELKRWQARAQSGGEHLGYLPVVRQDASYTAIVNLNTAKPLAVLEIDPWPDAPAPKSKP